jgi:hypothetical protein
MYLRTAKKGWEISSLVNRYKKASLSKISADERRDYTKKLHESGLYKPLVDAVTKACGGRGEVVGKTYEDILTQAIVKFGKELETSVGKKTDIWNAVLRNKIPDWKIRIDDIVNKLVPDQLTAKENPAVPPPVVPRKSEPKLELNTTGYKPTPKTLPVEPSRRNRYASLLMDEYLNKIAKKKKLDVSKAIKKPGSLRRHFGLKEGEKIPVGKATEEYKRLQGKESLTKKELSLLRKLSLFLNVLKPAGKKEKK